MCSLFEPLIIEGVARWLLGKSPKKTRWFNKLEWAHQNGVITLRDGRRSLCDQTGHSKVKRPGKKGTFQIKLRTFAIK